MTVHREKKKSITDIDINSPTGLENIDEDASEYNNQKH